MQHAVGKHAVGKHAVGEHSKHVQLIQDTQGIAEHSMRHGIRQGAFGDSCRIAAYGLCASVMKTGQSICPCWLQPLFLLLHSHILLVASLFLLLKSLSFLLQSLFLLLHDLSLL